MELKVSAVEYADDVVAKFVTTIEWVPLAVPGEALAVKTLEFEDVADTSVN